MKWEMVKEETEKSENGEGDREETEKVSIIPVATNEGLGNVSLFQCPDSRTQFKDWTVN